MEGRQWSHLGGWPVPELAAPRHDRERNRARHMQATATAHAAGDERHGETDRHQLFISSMT